MNEKRPQSGFEELEHTADWAMRAWAADLPGLFVECARGMYTLSGIEVGLGERVQRRVELEAPDRETLLVDFLGELLFLAEDDGQAFDQLDIQLNGTKLVAQLTGGPVAAIRKEIKAVTYHGMSIKQEGGQYSVEVVFDV
jgi:SHS2 domain-containing protein